MSAAKFDVLTNINIIQYTSMHMCNTMFISIILCCDGYAILGNIIPCSQYSGFYICYTFKLPINCRDWTVLRCHVWWIYYR